MTGAGALSDGSCGSDAALAAAIQRQIEEDNDREVRQREKLENKRLGLSGNSKLSVSHANHYMHAQDAEGQWSAGAMGGSAVAEPQSPPAERALQYQELIALGFTLDEKSGQWRDAEGQLVTKHNRLLSGRQNTKRLAGMDGLAGDFGARALAHGAIIYIVAIIYTQRQCDATHIRCRRSRRGWHFSSDAGVQPLPEGACWPRRSASCPRQWHCGTTLRHHFVPESLYLMLHYCRNTNL
eukprot:SAG31_NODE_5012_length_2802_cov_1.688494_3_plen_239_part_00